MKSIHFHRLFSTFSSRAEPSFARSLSTTSSTRLLEIMSGSQSQPQPKGILSSSSRPPLDTHHSSSFKATSLAVAAARRFTLMSPSSESVQPSLIDLSPSLHPDDTESEDRLREREHEAFRPVLTQSLTLSPKSNRSNSSLTGLLSPRFEDPNPSKSPRSPRSHSPLSRVTSFPAPWRKSFSTSTNPEASSTSPRPDLHRRRSSAAPKYKWLSGGGGTGDEPGVDVRSTRDEEAYGHLKAETKVTVVDYSSDPEAEDTNVRIEFKGSRLADWLKSEGGKRKIGQDGKPVGVRWIHVEGLNWQVIKTLTLQYNLHPLSVEDALRSSGSPRSKLDFYRTHLYMQILVQHMHPPDEALLSLASDALDDDTQISDVSTGGGTEDEIETVDLEGGLGSLGGDPNNRRTNGSARRSWWKELKTNRWRRKMMKLPEGVEGVFEPSLGLGPRNHHGNEQPMDKHTHRIVVDQLSAKYMIPVRRGILSVFLTRDGTLISMSRRPSKEVLDHIYDRLEDEHSLLRRSGDPSMLAHAILDVVVDLSLEISQAFESEILKLESSVLVDPEVEIVRHLHILSSQLIRLRRTLAPLLHLCYIIRDQEVQRAAAASTLLARTDKKLFNCSSSNIYQPGDSTTDPSIGQEHQGHHGEENGIDPTSDLLHLNRANQWVSSPHHSSPNLHHTFPQVLIDGLPDMSMSPTSSLNFPGDVGGNDRQRLIQPTPVPYGLAGNSLVGGGLGFEGGQSLVTPTSTTPTPGARERDSRTGRPTTNVIGSTGTNNASSTPGPRPLPLPGPGSANYEHGFTPSSTTGPSRPALGAPGSSTNVPIGFFSPMTKVYISDVIDHLELVVGSMDQFVATCDHLTDYVFNSLSFQTNASMERLSIVTVVFLPLTFIASYFGMNFEPFPELENGEIYFWKIAAPCTIGFFLIFSWTYLKAGILTLGRRIERSRRTRAVVGMRKLVAARKKRE